MGMDGRLSDSSYKKALKWLGREKLVCERCGEELHPGDRIHRSGRVYLRKNPYNGRLHPNENCRFYHAECFERLFLEL